MKRNGWVNTLPVDWSGNELNIGMNEIFAGKKRKKPNQTAKKKMKKKKGEKKNIKYSTTTVRTKWRWFTSLFCLK